MFVASRSLEKSGLKPSMRSTQPTRMSIVEKQRTAPVSEEAEELAPSHTAFVREGGALLQKRKCGYHSTVAVPSSGV